MRGLVYVFAVILLMSCDSSERDDSVKNMCYRPLVCGITVGLVMNDLHNMPPRKWFYMKRWEDKCFRSILKTITLKKYKDTIYICESGEAFYGRSESINKLTECCSGEIKKLYKKIKDYHEEKQLKRLRSGIEK